MFAQCPADVILVTSAYLDTPSLLQLRSVNHVLHDIVTPSVLQYVHLSLTQIRGTEAEDVTKRLQTCSTPLPNFYQSARHLKVKIDGWYIRRYVPDELLPDLWKTLSLLQSLISVEFAWKYGYDDDEETRIRVQNIRSQVASAIMKATGSRLEKLTIHPPIGELDIPKPFLHVQGLIEFGIDYEQSGWGCDESSESDGEEAGSKAQGGPPTCDCKALPVDTDIAGILAANPTLQDLRIVHGCLGKGYPAKALFTSQLSDLRSITMEGLSTWGIETLLPAPSFQNLRHVNIMSSYQYHPVDPLWASMKAAGTILETLVTAQISSSLIDFLASFSGLRNLKIDDIITDSSCSSPKITSSFFDLALPRHFSTLESFSLSYGGNVKQIPGWDFDPVLWSSFLPKMTALKSLHIPPYAPEGSQAAQIAARYQTVIDTVQLVPNLELLQIHWPDRIHGCGTGRMKWVRSCVATLDETVKDLRCDGEVAKPKTLRLFNGIHRAIASGGSSWRYALPKMSGSEWSISDRFPA
ncbi:hypothetical protein BDN72DRAFT_957701 [Pluteus cervinus]|uniref:Uncharacterized protein n=1 Tax=Pluteus cervinus TaxID=181527 RepID=A0ACD3B2X6_9AGAR|nr:hypothetical protein BDN72DRAFT_957701 [Pluteus cervinus]